MGWTEVKKKKPNEEAEQQLDRQEKSRGEHSITEASIRKCFRMEAAANSSDALERRYKRRSQKLQWDLAMRIWLVTIVSVEWWDWMPDYSGLKGVREWRQQV